MKELIHIQNLKRHYDVKKIFGPKRVIKALDGVTLTVEQGKTLAIVGESGCGKSTLAKLLLGIESPTEGEILLDGRSKNQIAPSEYRRAVQMIFQDPYSSLNPRKRALDIIAEPLLINTELSRTEAHARAREAMSQVGLRPELSVRYPHMLSGGQRQRIGIARALVLKPRVLICDEPISALDVSIQAQVINLLIELQNEFGLSYVFISHDLSVVRHLADRVAVMYLGKVVEQGERDVIFSNPRHPYTRALLASTPQLRRTNPTEKTQIVIQGEPPSPLNPPSGCAFHQRCPFAVARCLSEAPRLREVSERLSACHFD